MTPVGPRDPEGVLPAGQPHHEQGDGHHVTLVPVVLQVELDLLEDVDLLVCKEALGVDRQKVNCEPSSSYSFKSFNNKEDDEILLIINIPLVINAQ